MNTGTAYLNHVSMEASSHTLLTKMGYMRLQAGLNLLGIEGEVAWATPGQFTVHNFPCSEDGKNCVVEGSVTTQFYQDPSENVVAHHKQLGITHASAVKALRA